MKRRPEALHLVGGDIVDRVSNRRGLRVILTIVNVRRDLLQVRLLIHPVRALHELGVYIIQTILLNQRILVGEQIGSHSKAVSVNLDPERCQRCREIVDRRKLPVVITHRLDSRVEIAGINLSPVIVGCSGADLLVHRRMIAGDDNRRVVIPVLLLDPFHKFCNLLVGEVDHILVLIREDLLIPGILVPFRIMGIDGQHREVKRFSGIAELRQLVLCILKELRILKSPPDLVVGRQCPICRVQFPVIKIEITMFCEAETPSAECCVRAKHHLHGISLFRENIAQAGQVREERILRVHEVCSDTVDFNRNLQRKPACRSPHACHRPCTVLERIAAIQFCRLILPGKIDIIGILCKLGQLGNQAFIEETSAVPIRVGHLHRLQKNVNQVSFLLRKCQCCRCRIDIIVLDISGLLAHGGDPLPDSKLVPDSANLDTSEDNCCDCDCRKEKSSDQPSCLCIFFRIILPDCLFLLR